jgi:endonuclease I
VSVPGGAAAPPALPDAGLADALAALADAGSRPYFDAAADIAARDAYYAGVEMTLDPAALYRRLSALLGDTHAFRPPYKPARYVYPWVDWHPDRKLRSVYSDIAYEPEAFIREDFRIATERVARTRELLAAETSADPVVLAEAIDLLEAALPYNCEHSVPQSWFAKKEPMRGDLHHLFACESGCNSFRGNHAYWDFPDFEEAIRSDCGRREENRFEPSSPAGKGVVARATFYFLLRYPGEIAAAGGELDVERLPVLLAWNRQSPPGEYERHRNQAIFEIQGNRNPLIDHPEWAERIDFAAGFGS